MLDGNVHELRSRYLFDLAHVCHMDGRQVDALLYSDFCLYILEIDAYYKAKKKAQEQR